MKNRFLLLLFILLIPKIGDGDLTYSNYDGINVSSAAVPVQYFFDTGDRWSVYAGIITNGTKFLTSVELNLELISGSADDVKIYLYDGVGSPDNLIAELFSSTPISIQANYMFSPTQNISLVNGETYRVVVEPNFVNGTAVAWYHTPSGLGSEHSEATGTSWGSWQGEAPELTVRLFADAVPEPSTFLIFMISGVCLFLVRNKRTVNQ